MRYLLGLTIFYFSTYALAQEPVICPERPEDEDSRNTLAGVWFSKGAKLVEAENYAGAVLAFQCSIQMIEHASTVYNAATAAMLSELDLPGIGGHLR